MGYFDALAASSFKDIENGKRAFYPWGRFGKGYVLRDDEQYQTLRRLLINYYMVSLGIAVGLALWLHWIALAVIPIGGLYFQFAIRKHLRGLPRTDEQLTAKERYEAQARRHSSLLLWTVLVLSLAFIAGGIALLFGTGEIAGALLIIAIFGTCGGIAASTLLTRRRLLRQPDPEKTRVFD